MIPSIGLFDSGVGGLSVLRTLQTLAPHAELLYVADSGHAPYGERNDVFVQQRSLWVTQCLREQGAQVIVVACNTATASAISLLRHTHADLPIVGVEPGIKPAVALSGNGRIGVLATEVTLRSEKFRQLMHTHAGTAQLFLQPCPGLALAIEQGDLDGPQVRALVEKFCEPLSQQQVDTVVLGCTHYVFVARHIQAALGPQVHLLDTAEAVSRHALTQCPSSSAPSQGRVRLWTSGSVPMLAQIAQRWLPFSVSVDALPSA
jgi:glutamate racemase